MVFYGNVVSLDRGGIIDYRYIVRVIFVIIWGIPAFMVVRGYLKMNTDDKKSAINDFMSRHFIFTIGFIVIGFFFTQLGTLFAVSIIRIMVLF
ncbi:hypothetical protein [Lysinibacillus xylanilyticus]|uniref:Uncharacterized protein n=1 Tax=Lysinibacillus xylanilyticus TaxID=582475 RepID=A0A2M9Q5P9_9BACI|nr:hypothetical protein [Lysinibacillus xylanilyticus]PJO43398.1 hypothetical protein CWD94_12670 [Lysinibacillus xylanilyticus]